MNLPTKITFSRIIATCIMLLALFFLWVFKPDGGYSAQIGDTSLNWIYLALFIFFVIASYTDHLDGKLARKNNQITELGKFLDPIADKLLVNSLVIFLCIPNVLIEGQIAFPFWCVIILITRDIIVDGLRFMAAQKGTVIAANIFGKLKTVLEMVAIGAFLLNDWPFAYFDTNWGAFRISYILAYLATIASVVSGIIYLVQNKSAFIEEKK